MTTRANRIVHGARARARLALALLLAASLLSSGCGVRVLGRSLAVPGLGVKQKSERPREAKRKSGAPAREAKQEAPERLDDFGQARAQAALAPAEPYWPFHLAELYVAADSLREAESALRASLSRERTYAPALSLLSKLCWDAGRHAEAVRMLQVVRSEPAAFSPEARQALLAGLALHEDALGDPGAAKEHMPSDPRAARHGIGSAMVYVMLRGATPDSAGALAEAALDEGPRSAVNLNNTGITRLRAGDAAGARKAFLAAIDRDQRLPGPYYNLAILEKFYRFDDEAAARWFGAYRQRSQADPDSLLGTLGPGPQKNLAQKGE